ncbi:PQQ-dependent dehydrogenase (s-GDH family) [Kibdelosporangium banguiense]|uniref:PQQ-dependent dehydrogenase (S-GDH family) n=1 Tax=Kibdelosporangium banguiense TaxID=1365924 RepID=A0ABS4TQV5_9PSEU|nr:glucose/sorbosone family PQQ-dependent dehydrogenase [Kibdelosporangium banguiense]MBP2326797.1 PQQ-dependent dehydrogenase (s-GDH family) [Kibdelosporangium banguiense]
MKRLALALTLVTAVSPVSAATAETGRAFTSRVVTSGLADPYEITFGPDGMLWATEKSGLRVLRIDPQTGAQHTAVTIPDAIHTDWSQDGVLGMALHPGLLKGRDHVFVAYTYDSDPGPAQAARTKIARYTYDPQTQQLGQPVDVITGLAGGVDHQSARLVFGPDGKLYYTIGEQGANQFGAKCLPIQAQRLPTAAEVQAKDWTAYRGKVLRLNQDGSIPADNPVLGGVRSHVFSYGHRNAQGLVFGTNGLLYSSEQGPKTDDEVNIIGRGKNYGWPHVAGYRDDKAYVYGNWSAAPDCEQLDFSDYEIPPSVPQATETSWNHPDFVPPIRTFHTVPSDHNFMDPQCADGEMWYLCWPTVAPASLDFVSRGALHNSLLMPALKDGTVYRLALTHDGKRVDSVEPLWRTTNRYRDTAISPDGKTFYVATDSTGNTKDATGKPTNALANPGSILEFKLGS